MLIFSCHSVWCQARNDDDETPVRNQSNRDRITKQLLRAPSKRDVAERRVNSEPALPVARPSIKSFTSLPDVYSYPVRKQYSWLPDLSMVEEESETPEHSPVRRSFSEKYSPSRSARSAHGSRSRSPIRHHQDTAEFDDDEYIGTAIEEQIAAHTSAQNGSPSKGVTSREFYNALSGQRVGSSFNVPSANRMSNVSHDQFVYNDNLPPPAAVPSDTHHPPLPLIPKASRSYQY